MPTRFNDSSCGKKNKGGVLKHKGLEGVVIILVIKALSGTPYVTQFRFIVINNAGLKKLTANLQL